MRPWLIYLSREADIGSIDPEEPRQYPLETTKQMSRPREVTLVAAITAGCRETSPPSTIFSHRRIGVAATLTSYPGFVADANFL